MVSGINLGANMGDDTIYSGTVAAAIEGYLLGVPSIAISLASKRGAHFETAARVARELVERFQRQAFGEPVLLNVNVPDVPLDDCTASGSRAWAAATRPSRSCRQVTPRDETVYWVGAAGEAADAGEGTDFHAVANGYVSVTPLQIDLTHAGQIGTIRSWLAK